MYDKKFWDDVYKKGFIPWTDKGKDASFAEHIIYDTELNQSSKILDYGCGEGILGKYFLKHGMNVDFAEISETQVSALRKKLGDKSHVYQVNEPRDITQKYDLIICSAVMHHIEPAKWQDFLSQFNELLNDGGKLWISGFDYNDKIYQMYNGNAPATGHTCWPINNLSKIIEGTNFEIVAEYSHDVKVKAFDQPRHFHFVCLKTKDVNNKSKEKSPNLKFNESDDRVEYINQKIQNLRDKRQNSVSHEVDSLADKQQKMKKALRDNDIAPEEMGKTGEKDGNISKKNRKIADIQWAEYKKILETKNERKKQ